MRLMITSSFRAVTLLALMVAVGERPARAGSLTPGDLLVNSSNLVSNSSTLQEYTTGGSLVQSFTIPAPANRLGTEYARDIIVDPSGLVQVYNGTFTPVLTTLNPTTGSLVDHGGPAGWSTVNATDYGGIATYQNFLFATDMSTASPGTPSGIIRFDLNDYSSIRFGDTSATNPVNGDYLDLTVGANGSLYALRPGGSPQGTTIDVFNPLSTALLQTITLSGARQSAGIAVAATGDIYSVEFLTGTIDHFNANGVFINSLNTGLADLQDIDLSNTGQLVVGGRFGDVVLTTTALSSFSHFNVGSNPTFVAFTTPLTPASVPEPGSLVLFGTGVLGLLGSAVRRGLGRSRSARIPTDCGRHSTVAP